MLNGLFSKKKHRAFFFLLHLLCAHLFAAAVSSILNGEREREREREKRERKEEEEEALPISSPPPLLSSSLGSVVAVGRWRISPSWRRTTISVCVCVCAPMLISQIGLRIVRCTRGKQIPLLSLPPSLTCHARCMPNRHRRCAAVANARAGVKMVCEKKRNT